MFKKLFGKEKKEEVSEVVLMSPMTGNVVDLGDVPDPVFSQKMMGDGVAISPSEGKVVAPADAKILNVFPTKHAIGLETAGGLEILIHVGLDTVNMKGEGFNAHVAEGDRVKKGDLLLTYNLELVQEKAASTITPMIISNGDIVKQLDKHENVQATAGETPVMTVKL
ncbi:PTS sugar transporter subunit IIA [Domibacillus epiphyticus]|uniref:PTS glucose transporter subunit IIA n=1 Tax=Domibacillus epiphyticus TaxID=1714355 RepID=A0A1V2A631_9BACI|nr:PTS glucose transporter subunit IIA [Domibacillus epiphyticus]OMP66453.1 PTS glucose transporter subunit IIA [Domibacillus epiphyticus]